MCMKGLGCLKLMLKFMGPSGKKRKTRYGGWSRRQPSYHHDYYERSSYRQDHSPHSSRRSSYHSHHSSPEVHSPQYNSPRNSYSPPESVDYSSHSNSAQPANVNQSLGCNRRRRSSVNSWRLSKNNSTDVNNSNEAGARGPSRPDAGKMLLVHRRQQKQKQQQQQQQQQQCQPQSGPPPRSGFKAKRKKRKKKLRLCKAKRPGECDVLQLRLCPRLGNGHTHEQLIEEVTPVLLRSAQNVNCQLTEICRRIVFMQQNIPHMTSPVLARFHAIMARITQMLMADFASFPEGLRLPSCEQTSS